MTRQQAILKRSFDVIFAFLGLLITGWLILFCFILASISTRANGFFIQQRVGRKGRLFPCAKIRTMRNISGLTGTVTVEGDERITSLGRVFRKTKLDELPQLWNIFIGQMSFVGPRPDVLGFADQLEGEDRRILLVRPGLTGPATLRFRDEEKILSQQADPEKYNREIIWPEKMKLNLDYINNYTFTNDLILILKTLLSMKL